MKKNKYQLFEEINSGLFLHYCTSTNSFILMSRCKHQLYTESTEDYIRNYYPEFYNNLVDNGFIIEANVDETAETIERRERLKFDRDEYHLVINTTLDCNLNCWYCYESRVAGSRLSEKCINLIKKNISYRFLHQPFKRLRVSFFGGEPFLDFDGMKAILNYAKRFTCDNGILLTADFTTNATLIDSEIIQYLSEFQCSFQITLDGDRDRHNKIKFCKGAPFDTYQATINSLKLIDKYIENRYISVRVNFDNKTLMRLDEILEDISFLNRKKSMVILKRIWQINSKNVDHNLLLNSIQRVFDKGFLLDYYVMPKGCLCFADRESQALFNYDGKIFKCTTISDFDENNSLGIVDEDSGEIKWKTEKANQWMTNLQREQCVECRWFPVCLGICNKQIISNPGANLCNIEGLSLSSKEYLIYLFKFNLLKHKLLNNKSDSI